MGVLEPILVRTPVATMQEVLQVMRDIAAVLPARDGIARFNQLYTTVTANVIHRAPGREAITPICASTIGASEMTGLLRRPAGLYARMRPDMTGILGENALPTARVGNQTGQQRRCDDYG
jgi:hypothetical protein